MLPPLVDSAGKTNRATGIMDEGFRMGGNEPGLVGLEKSLGEREEAIGATIPLGQAVQSQGSGCLIVRFQSGDEGLDAFQAV